MIEPTPTRIGRDDASGRDLFMLTLARPEDLPERVALSSPRFVCLVAWDASTVSVKEIGAFARKLLDSGAGYICAWGPDCERVHDIIDDECLRDEAWEDDERFVMTTWHAGEPLEEVLYFVLDCTWHDRCGSTLGIAIGSELWADETKAAFSDPRGFVARCVERG